MGALDFLHNSWQANQSPETLMFPVVNSGPWIIVVILSAYYFGLKYAYKKQKEIDWNLNPILIPYFGFFFGCYFAGSILGVFLTTKFIPMFSCENNLDPFQEMLTHYLGFVFFIFVIVHLFDSILLILNDNKKQVSAAHILEKATLVFRIYTDIKFFVGGVGSFLPLMYAFIAVIQSSYLIRFFSSTEFRPKAGWQRTISGLKSLSWLIILLHNYYVYNILNCPRGSLLKFFNIAQSLILFLFYLREYVFVVGSAKSSKGRVFKPKEN